MPVLTIQQRNTLESFVKKARKLAETGARNALQALAVNTSEPFAHMTAEQRTLRNRLRNKARLLGDELPSTGQQQIDHLSYELAYENWHKMLFAKFLEANGLLMHTSGVAVTMEECEELAKEEGFADKWQAAAVYASKMLPAIFMPGDPIIQVHFASNDRIKLEGILDGLDNYIFRADDALGWVYQFWQSEAKKVINDSQEKIDGAKLPAVTQLFTEPYMVHFLIDNTIGAWWVSRHTNETPPVKFEYLRLLGDGAAAAGSFENWPNSTKEITALDPCMGSGHFLASLFTIFARLRMYEEGISAGEAANRVIKENLHGLELDARCTQIAAFNLALTAWKFIGYYKQLPEMNLACSGVAPKGKREDWVKLGGKIGDPALKARIENGMRYLYDHFQLAPELGSLLNPARIEANMYTASFDELQPILQRALKDEDNYDQIDREAMAAGIAKAGQLLAMKYTLQITNVPYLGRSRQTVNGILSNYSEKEYPEAQSDLATVFLCRMQKLSSTNGIVACVIPQNWLFLTRYSDLREVLLKAKKWNFIARLGAGAFSQISGEIVKAILISISTASTTIEDYFFSIDVSKEKNVTEKEKALLTFPIKQSNQLQQLRNPDKKIILEDIQSGELLNTHAFSWQGIKTSDDPRFCQFFWEVGARSSGWVYYQRTPKTNLFYSGRSEMLFWEDGHGSLTTVCQKGASFRGKSAWGKLGLAISTIGNLPTTIYTGEKFSADVSIIQPRSVADLSALWLYCTTKEYVTEVRKVDQALRVTNIAMAQVPFDIEYWRRIAEEKYPNSFPKPYSDDVTQWLFHGNVTKTENPLQVAVARLLGYRWPAEKDLEMELADEARGLIKQIKAFDYLTDKDGIVCIPPVNGELAASERLRSYLQVVYDSKWSNSTISQLLQKEGTTVSNLEDWLRTSFFEQHCKLFQARPFIWHIWDGRKDGFSALVNCHKLDKEALQRLIFTYLGDWIRQCEAKLKFGESGAEGLLSAALKLKEKLEAILEGETPYDIFVRWKPLVHQPNGFEPDLNDGVRLNIRPFVTADILRKKPNIKWGIDRGKNPPGSYWGEIRDNDRHLSLEEKRKQMEKLRLYSNELQ